MFPLQLGGCGILGVGVWLSVTQGNFATLSSSLPSLSAANLLIAVGTIIMVIGCLGCVGAVKESRPLLLTVSYMPGCLFAPPDFKEKGCVYVMMPFSQNTFCCYWAWNPNRSIKKEMISSLGKAALPSEQSRQLARGPKSPKCQGSCLAWQVEWTKCRQQMYSRKLKS